MTIVRSSERRGGVVSRPAALRVLVTGASGFIGRHSCRGLLERGHEVRAAVRRSTTGLAPAEIVILDEIGPDTDWTAALSGVDVVLHLAGRAHRLDQRRGGDEEPYFRLHEAGTAALAVAAVRAGVRRVVYVSSIAVHGEASRETIDHETAEVPVDPYGRSKLAGERALTRALHGTPVEWCILRPALVYGNGNPGNMARLVRLTRLPLPLPLGAIRNHRSFLFVGNLVDAIDVALRHPAAANGTFPLADAEPVSTPAVVRAIATATGRRKWLLPVPVRLLAAAGRMGDGVARLTRRPFALDSYAVERLTRSLVVDSSAFRRRTGWSPPFSAGEGLLRTFGPPHTEDRIQG